MEVDLRDPNPLCDGLVSIVQPGYPLAVRVRQSHGPSALSPDVHELKRLAPPSGLRQGPAGTCSHPAKALFDQAIEEIRRGAKIEAESHFADRATGRHSRRRIPSSSRNQPSVTSGDCGD